MLQKSTIRVILFATLPLSQSMADDLVRVKDINPGPGYSSPSNFVRRGDFVYFAALTTTSGRELWRTNGTEAGTTLVKDLTAGTGSGFNSDEASFSFGMMGGNLYFKSQDNFLWRSDGTAAGTIPLNPDKTLNLIGVGMFPVGNAVYFTGATNATGTELWKTDGTVGGTSIVADINGGPDSSRPANLAVAGGALFFSTSVTTHLLRADPGGLTWMTPISSYSQPLTIGNLLYFMGNDGSHGIELMKTDGTASGTTVVKDFTPGSANSELIQLTRVGTSIYFVKGNDLWKTDGTDAGTVKVFTRDTEDFTFNSLTGVGDTLYFTAGKKEDGRELWKSDGTLAGTAMVKDIYPGSKKSAAPEMLVPVGNHLYFRANDGVNGITLWKSDGTANGTVRLTGPSPERIYFDGQQRIYCSAYGLDGSGWELYKYDVPASELSLGVRENWRMTYFGNSANNGEGADGEDPDHDGLTNLMEFALGGNPKIANSEATATPSVQGGKPVVVPSSGIEIPHVLFSRRSGLGDAGITAVPQFSSTLSGWQDATGTPQVVTSENGVDLLSMDVPEELRTSGTVFFRMKVEAPE